MKYNISYNPGGSTVQAGGGLHPAGRHREGWSRPADAPSESDALLSVRG